MNVLAQATDIVRRKWYAVGKGWKVALVILAVFAAIVFIVYMFLRAIIKLLQALSAGGARNAHLYIPRMPHKT